MRSSAGRVVVWALVMASSPALAAAQTGRTADLDPRLVGKTIFVTDVAGQQTAGVLEEIVGTGLVLGPERRTFDWSTVREIRRSDDNWNGMLIGAVAGVLPVILARQAAHPESGSGSSELVKLASLFGAVGAAAGWSLDNGAKHPGRVVWASSPNPRAATVVFRLAVDRQAVIVAFGF